MTQHCYLLAEWRMGRDLSKAGLPEFATALAFFRGPIERFIAKAETARDDAALAGASSLFVSAVSEIGAERLKAALETKVFGSARDSIKRQVPPPTEVQQAFAPRVEPVVFIQPANRVREYDSFGYRGTAAPTEEVAFFRAQLSRTEISPELRWFYEEKLRAIGQPPYRTAEDAEAVWRAMLAGSLHPDLRQYFAGNLATLRGGTVEV